MHETIDKLTALKHAGHMTWNEVESGKLRQSKYEEELMKTAGQMSEMRIRMKDTQTQTVYGNTGSSQTNGFTTMGSKNIMEFRSVSSM